MSYSLNNIKKNPIQNFIDKKKIKKILISDKDDYIKINNNENNNNYNDNNNSESDNESESVKNLERELENKINCNNISYPKNYGNFWNDKERNLILNTINNNNIFNFEEEIIKKISSKLERTEYAVVEEIKKMIFNEFLKGINEKKISKKFNILESNIKLIIKLYIKKNSKKIIESINNENKILKLQIENIKLKKELEEINNN